MTNIGISECREFAEALGSEDLLEKAMDWMTKNLSPEDIFDDAALGDWAKDNAANTLSPDEVFTDKELGEWAEDNGYTKDD